jgi:hypothetical protein
MKYSINQLPVIFRKWRGGQIIALFPTVPANLDGFTCQSYQHVGQHGAADPYGLIRETKSATPKEYKELLGELHQIGYKNLKIYKRLQYKHLEEMRKVTREYK